MVEGKNFIFEFRNAEKKPERLPALADDLVRLKVDVIVAGGPNDGRAAKKATGTIPIVFTGFRAIRLRVALSPAWRSPVGTSRDFTQWRMS